MKSCLKVINKLADMDYTEEAFDFTNATDKQIYGRTFVQIIPKLGDVVIDESFYCDENDDSADISDFQDHLLSLIRYIFKTVSVRSLVKLGLKQKHFQFIIVNFCRSEYLPQVNKSYEQDNFIYIYFVE